MRRLRSLWAVGGGANRYRINPIGIAGIAVGCAAVLVALFLSAVDSPSGRSGISHDALIQGGARWYLVPLVLLAAYLGLRSVRRGVKYRWITPIGAAVIASGVLAAKGSSLDLKFPAGEDTVEIVRGSVGIGVYVAVIGGALIVLGALGVEFGSPVATAREENAMNSESEDPPTGRDLPVGPTGTKEEASASVGPVNESIPPPKRAAAPAAGDPPSVDAGVFGSVLPPGWYADPAAPGGQRYWDGSRWARSGAQATLTLPTRIEGMPRSWWWAAASASLMVLGSLGPWVEVLGGAVSASGTKGDGWIVIAAAIPALWLLWSWADGRANRRRLYASGGLGLGGAAIAIYDLIDIARNTYTSPGWGIWLAGLAGLGLLVSAVVLIRESSNVTSSPA